MNIINELLKDIPIPRMVKVKTEFRCTRVNGYCIGSPQCDWQNGRSLAVPVEKVNTQKIGNDVKELLIIKFLIYGMINKKMISIK